MISVHAQYRRPLVRIFAVLSACVAVLLAFVFVPALHFELPVPLNVSLHTLFETVSVMVSVLVFSAGWFTFSRQGSSNVALISSAFFGVAILDFVHLLSYEGMPNFLTPSGGGKSISFFLAARLLVAVALLAIALLPWQRRIGNTVRYWLLALTVVFALAVSAYGLVEPALIALFYIPGSGLTLTKIALEYLIVLLNLAAAAGFYRHMREPQPYPLVPLFAAACLMALSELCFTLYSTFQDQYSLVGHVLKVMAYLFVFRAIFVEFLEGPYRQLESARADLVESEEKYRLLFENSPDAYLIANADGSFQTANPAAFAMFGIARQDLWRIGRDDVTNDPRRAGFLEERSRAGFARGELIMQRSNGTTFLGELSSFSYMDSRGRQMQSTFVRDISEKKKAEEEILSLNASLEQRVRDRTAELQAVINDLERLSHVMAHDLRSPLVVIEGFAGLLKRDAAQLLDEKQNQYLDRIRASARRMAEMIDALLELADVARSPLKIQQLDIAAMADKALWSCQKREPQRMVRAVVQRPVLLEGDARMISLVMETLIGTAWKNTARIADAEITVGAESGPAGETVCFVRYQGEAGDGVAGDQVVAAQPAFSTPEDATSADIALDNMRRAIARHGGRVWREPTPGRGAIYRFTLGQPRH
jgi:PAS domain S-box-containing protein